MCVCVCVCVYTRVAGEDVGDSVVAETREGEGEMVGSMTRPKLPNTYQR